MIDALLAWPAFSDPIEEGVEMTEEQMRAQDKSWLEQMLSLSSQRMSVKACVPGKHVDLLNIHNVRGFLSNLVSPWNADIMVTIGSLVNVAGYFSLVASECAEHAEIDAMCAGITGSLFSF